MRVAICGYPPLAQQKQELLQNDGVEIKFFIRDFVSNLEEKDNCIINLPLISFFEFRRLINVNELDGVIIAERNFYSDFTKSAVQIFKFYNIPQIGVFYYDVFKTNSSIFWLSKQKNFLPYLESDITDKCNLNCVGCCHFANFTDDEEFYPLKNFQRDLNQISKICDVIMFRMLGGEPLTLKNLEEYLIFARKSFPNSFLTIVTNGLLIPSLSQKIFDILREKRIAVDISLYPPILKILDKVKARLAKNKIAYRLSPIKNFFAQMTLNGNNDPVKTTKVCRCGLNRSIRNGKLYKCPIDSASYKFAKKFGIENFSSPTGLDIYSANFSALLPLLEGEVELCYWCAENYRPIEWKTSNKPRIEDYLADPDEVKNFL